MTGLSRKAILNLSGEAAIAEGSKRLVFRAPGDDSLLVKVVRPDRQRNWTRPHQKWKRPLFRSGPTSILLDEVREEFSLRQMDCFPDFLAPIYGFSNTNLGLGLIVKAVLNEDRSLGLNLRQIIRGGHYDTKIAFALDRFFEELVASPIVVSDLTPSNIVCVRSGSSWNCMLVDGAGDDSMFRVVSLSQAANRWTKKGFVYRCRMLIANELKRLKVTAASSAFAV